jgi:plasmid maintenance system antidote protein VapI
MKEKEKKALQAAQAERVKSIISELEMTQGKFADALGVSNDTISLVCTCKRNLSEGLAFRIGQKYGINPQWLLSGEGEKYASTEIGQLQRQNQLKQIAALRATIQTALEQLDQLEEEVTK